jgi:2-dehydro-3-deoxyphosphogluconate aldolase/(4S)-4-hydroxy-2-oxoglutarate aldolase
MTAANAVNYLALPNVMCVGGTWMIDSTSLSGGDWASIQRRTAEALAALA